MCFSIVYFALFCCLTARPLWVSIARIVSVCVRQKWHFKLFKLLSLFFSFFSCSVVWFCTFFPCALLLLGCSFGKSVFYPLFFFSFFVIQFIHTPRQILLVMLCVCVNIFLCSFNSPYRFYIAGLIKTLFLPMKRFKHFFTPLPEMVFNSYGRKRGGGDREKKTPKRPTDTCVFFTTRPTTQRCFSRDP